MRRVGGEFSVGFFGGGEGKGKQNMHVGST